MEGVRAALRQMLGPHAGIGVTDPAQDAALWDEEAAAIARADPETPHRICGRAQCRPRRNGRDRFAIRGDPAGR